LIFKSKKISHNQNTPKNTPILQRSGIFGGDLLRPFFGGLPACRIFDYWAGFGKAA
jgi:hypothetical protein